MIVRKFLILIKSPFKALASIFEFHPFKDYPLHKRNQNFSGIEETFDDLNILKKLKQYNTFEVLKKNTLLDQIKICSSSLPYFDC